MREEICVNLSKRFWDSITENIIGLCIVGKAILAQ